MNKRVQAFINKHILNHLRNESGSVLVIFAAFMVVAIGFSALVIDLGALRLERSRLVNAVDAAALAGARELPNTTTAEEVAKSYAEMNDVPMENVTVTFGTQNETITVAATAEKDFFFAPVLGVDSGSTQAQATAAAGNIGGMKGLIPIGLQESVYNTLSADPDADGQALITKDNFGEIGPGNWGWVNLAYPENSNTHDQIEYITNGYQGMIYVDDKLRVDTGANIGTPANLNAELGEVLDQYITDGTTLYVPIICDTWVSGTSELITIRGFAAIKLIGYEGKSSSFSIEAVLNPDEPQFVPGSIDFAAGNFGLRGIALVQ